MGKQIMFSLAIVSALNVYGCSMYDGMSMKPHKTTISTNTSMTDIDKGDSDKDQEKQSLGLQIKQEFLWKDD
jgi:hypothetical protein|tara:strand:+ start:1689 stop:1904 length:216 start_codon:yes stop_codon:yes gene_type:complete